MLKQIIKPVSNSMFKKQTVYEQEKLVDAKAVKQDALESLTVTTSSGKVFYGDPVSRSDLTDAIALAEELGQTSTTWKLAEELNGSKIAQVTLEELKEARKLALQAKGQIVGV